MNNMGETVIIAVHSFLSVKQLERVRETKAILVQKNPPFLLRNYYWFTSSPFSGFLVHSLVSVSLDSVMISIYTYTG